MVLSGNSQNSVGGEGSNLLNGGGEFDENGGAVCNYSQRKVKELNPNLVPDWVDTKRIKLDDGSELSNLITRMLRDNYVRPRSEPMEDTSPSEFEWIVTQECDELGVKIKLWGCGNQKDGESHMLKIIRAEHECREMEFNILKGIDPVSSIPSGFQEKLDEASLGMRVERNLAAVHRLSSCPVVIKEFIPGKKVPWVDEFFTDSGFLLHTHRFMHPDCHDALPVEAPTDCLTQADYYEAEMIRNKEGLLLTPSLEDNYYGSKPSLLKITQNNLYPDLSIFGNHHKSETEVIRGKRFDIEKVGGETKVTPKNTKDKVVADDIEVNIAGRRFSTNKMYKEKLPTGKFKSGNRKMWIESNGRMSAIILYLTILNCCLYAQGYHGVIGSLCGNDKHGTLWSVPKVSSCDPHREEGDVFEAELYIKSISYALSSYICYEDVIEDVTMLGFLGTKSHLSHKETRRSVPVADCKSWILTKNTRLGKLKAISNSLWSTNIPHVIDYKYCCSSDTFTTSNYILKSVNVSIHPSSGSEKMISGDGDYSGCDYSKGECLGSDRTMIWEPKPVDCLYEPIGAGNFTRLADGSLFSATVQMSLQMTEQTTLCGRSMMGTSQGVFILPRGPILRKNRPRRDIDAAEKSFILAAAQKYTDDNVLNLYKLQCVNDAILAGYLREVGKSNPSRLARAYFGRDDIAAKTVGDALLVWECAKVEVGSINYSHRLGQVCYDLVPVEYEWNKKMIGGFMDMETLEIHPLSGSHDCDSVEGYVHTVDGEVRMYDNSGNYSTNLDIKEIPAHTVPGMTDHFFFKNTELHSIYGPAGSRYQESVVNEMASLASKLVISPNNYANPEYSETVTRKVQDLDDMLMGWIMSPWMHLAKILLIVFAVVAVYYVIKWKVGRTGLLWPSDRILPRMSALRWRTRTQIPDGEEELAEVMKT